MAAAAAALGAVSSLHPHHSLFLRRDLRRRIPLICVSSTLAAAAPSSSPADCIATFATSPHHKGSTKVQISNVARRFPSALPSRLLATRIVRGENGDHRPQSTLPKAVARRKGIDDDKRRRKKPLPAASSVAAVAAPPKYAKAVRRFYNENFREPQRLSKVLAAAGVASRRSSEELIFGGVVTVNGSVCSTPQTRVDIRRDSIYVKGNCLSKKLPPKLYFALNKPKGYICSSGEVHKSVVSLFDDYFQNWNKRHPGFPKPRLFTAGRLDVATSGLIVVTNDGDFAQKLVHPSYDLEKEYLVTIDGVVHRKHLTAISEGTQVDGTLCIPDYVELLTPNPDKSRSRLRIVVHEGKNHEVRELVKNAGLMLHSLKRVRIGRFRMPSGLGLGKFVELKQGDMKLFGKQDLETEEAA